MKTEIDFSLAKEVFDWQKLTEHTLYMGKNFADLIS